VNKSFKQYLTEQTLRTQKGSPIKRSSWGVGKEMGGFVYLHKNYIEMIPQQNLNAVYDAYQLVVQKTGQEPEFNVVKVSKSKPVVTFINSPDFDTASEPTVGDYINVNLETESVKRGSSQSIWHHKWLWVLDDYQGFDVEASIERSRKWLRMDGIDYKRIGKRSFWNKTVADKMK